MFPTVYPMDRMSNRSLTSALVQEHTDFKHHPDQTVPIYSYLPPAGGEWTFPDLSAVHGLHFQDTDRPALPRHSLLVKQLDTEKERMQVQCKRLERELLAHPRFSTWQRRLAFLHIQPRYSYCAARTVERSNQELHLCYHYVMPERDVFLWIQVEDAPAQLEDSIDLKEPCLGVSELRAVHQHAPTLRWTLAMRSFRRVTKPSATYRPIPHTRHAYLAWYEHQRLCARHALKRTLWHKESGIIWDKWNTAQQVYEALRRKQH